MKLKVLLILTLIISLCIPFSGCSKHPSKSESSEAVSKSNQSSSDVTSSDDSNTSDTGSDDEYAVGNDSYNFLSSSSSQAATSSSIPTSILNFSAWTDNNFWDTGIVYNETVVLYQENGKEANGYLMFNPTKIISVKNYSLNTTYVQGKDYNIIGNKITLTANSPIQVLTQAQYMPTDSITPNTAEYAANGGYLLYMENSFLVNKQITVTYEYDKSQWSGPKPTTEAAKLAQLREKLGKKQAIEQVVIGDSIGTGCNSSSFLNIKPHMPPWYILVEQKLEKSYGVKINVDNFSKGGETSDYGVSQADAAAAKNPDIAIIEYGMNDGTSKMPVDTYKQNIQTIIDTIRKSAPNCDFVVCAPTIPNPDCIQVGTQDSYLPVLQEISSSTDGVAVADFTDMNKAMLKNNKRFFDLSANDINHPNDFLQTAMAAYILKLIG